MASMEQLPLEILTEILSWDFSIKELAQMQSVSVAFQRAILQIPVAHVKVDCIFCAVSNKHTHHLSFLGRHLKRRTAPMVNLTIEDGRDPYLTSKRKDSFFGMLVGWIAAHRESLEEFNYIEDAPGLCCQKKRSCRIRATQDDGIFEEGVAVAKLLERLAACPKLRSVTLDVSGAALSNILDPPCNFLFREKLTELDLTTNCDFTDTFLEYLNDGCPSLKIFSLRGQFDSETSKQSKCTFTLSFPYLETCKIDWIVATNVKTLEVVIRKGACLETLCFRTKCFSHGEDAGFIVFKVQESELPGMRTLEVKNVHWTGAKVILESAPNVRSVVFRMRTGNGWDKTAQAPLGTAGPAVIMERMSISNPSLTRLHLAAGRLWDKSCTNQDVPSSGWALPSLQALKICRCSTEDRSLAFEGFRQLERILGSCTGLKSIELCGRLLTGPLGAQRMQEVLENFLNLQRKFPTVKFLFNWKEASRSSGV